jgi:tetratricopeptide (TPR) repeat protein
MSQHTSAANLVRQGIAAFKARQRQQAASLFVQATQLEPDNQLAWLWLAGCTSHPDEKRQHLLQAVQINPNNEIGQRAVAALAQLEESAQNQPSPPTVPPTAAPSPPAPPAASNAHARRVQSSGLKRAQMGGAIAGFGLMFCGMALCMFLPLLFELVELLPSYFTNPNPQTSLFDFGDLLWSSIIIVFFLLGASIKVIGSRQEKFWKQLQTWPVIQARVVDRWEDTDSEGSPVYFITYQFTATLPDGQPYHVSQGEEISKALYPQLTVGSDVNVRYVPEKPRIACLKDNGFANQ